ncbi:Arsenite oxidase small subunit precursor [Marinobacter santoriniensis NKSG1]|uniref:Arsenite oxidase small subunit n=1 Tax=Marinobacter santoriniensis NKSG1 TaxID=1288826 RepID=M7CUU9_9GAMM|nr:arsenate reductase (azurin) small subunit [Marinobacter santoriniensis]EMP56894.1 Arsenite oxidase small subunit precursor [Marinobacter santoriniensis NKSG1]|tara:strand:+ start:4704 stop:5237 length:534 start_codon:yes stop_codon:yes gene_type:complete
MKLSRRRFLAFTGTTAAGSAALGGSLLLNPAHAAEGSQQPGKVMLDYPKINISKASNLKVGQPVSFTYPDSSSPCTLIKIGRKTQGGVGPDGDIVAYSNLCTHMGCPVSYSSEERTFKCPCHFSVFDSELNGQMVSGQATENLPRILLTYRDSDDSIEATGVDGLIYGRQSNLLPGA